MFPSWIHSFPIRRFAGRPNCTSS